MIRLILSRQLKDKRKRFLTEPLLSCDMYQRKIPITLDCGLDLIGEVLYGK